MKLVSSNDEVVSKEIVTGFAATILRVIYEAINEIGVEPPKHLNLGANCRAVYRSHLWEFYQKWLEGIDDYFEINDLSMSGYKASLRHEIMRSRDRLMAKGVIGYKDGWYWLTGKRVRGFEKAPYPAHGHLIPLVKPKTKPAELDITSGICLQVLFGLTSPIGWPTLIGIKPSIGSAHTVRETVDSEYKRYCEYRELSQQIWQLNDEVNKKLLADHLRVSGEGGDYVMCKEYAVLSAKTERIIKEIAKATGSNEPAVRLLMGYFHKNGGKINLTPSVARRANEFIASAPHIDGRTRKRFATLCSRILEMKYAQQ